MSMELHRDCRLERWDLVVAVVDCTAGEEHVGTGVGIAAAGTAAVEVVDVTKTTTALGLVP
jgi:hypothetical protein